MQQRSEDNLRFWILLDLFFKNHGRNLTRADIVAILKLASIPEARCLIPDTIRTSLPFDPEHEKRWEKMKRFFAHPFIRNRDNSDFPYEQISLVAKNVGDVRIHSVSQETLPRYD